MSSPLFRDFSMNFQDPGHCVIDGKRYAMPFGPPAASISANSGKAMVFGEQQVLHQGMCASHEGCSTVVFNIERVPRQANSFSEAIERGYLVPT